MAESEPPKRKAIPFDRHDTALCIIPPPHLCKDIDRLRSLYDKGWARWPPHINLIYPFVHPHWLQGAMQRLAHAHLTDPESPHPLQLTLNEAGVFEHSRNRTVFLRADAQGQNDLDVLRTAVAKALHHEAPPETKLHLTLGQSEQQDHSDSKRDFLLEKAKLIPALQFELSSLAILVRERVHVAGQEVDEYRMRLRYTIPLAAGAANPATVSPKLPEFWIDAQQEPEDRDSYRYDGQKDAWITSPTEEGCVIGTSHLRVSSYNVLLNEDFQSARDPSLLLDSLLSRRAQADILVLQEVSDKFLSFLLFHSNVEASYPYTSHGPPSQGDIGPLPSIRNVVILSKVPFSWTWLPFHRKHKGAVIARFRISNKAEPEKTQEVTVAGIHLTCGLTDGAVAAKKVQLQMLKNYLGEKHANSSWIIAGDFNLTTSVHTITAALKNGSISEQTVETLQAVEAMLMDAELADTWSIAKLEGAARTASDSNLDHLFEGEDGATFNPQENSLAAASSGTSSNRPQRYDRILVRAPGILQPSFFNDFGHPKVVNGEQLVASDHYGIRATMKICADNQAAHKNDLDTLEAHPVHLKTVTNSLADTESLTSALQAQRMFPSPEETQNHNAAFTLIKEVIHFVTVPVGSYALGTWTSASDIDVLCIGSISTKTFFQLARQRIRRAEARGVRLVRKVEANTGTMFELVVNGVKMDLHYCPAAQIVERWTSDLPNLHHTDPIFNLPMLSLRKLKPYRDITYIRRSLPSLSTFRLAYRTIKLWAIQRGLYASRFGYLSGIHITQMLSWVCKRLAHDNGPVSVASVVNTFFHHYASFDWKNDIVFDAFFHKKQPRYHRTAREPMVVLGAHAPNANMAHTSTAPGLATLIREFKAAHERLNREGMTWKKFFSADDSAESPVAEFLHSHDSYAKIDIQYWGRSLAKGKSLVGWVESRCLLLVVDINKALPDLEVRIWPARFTSQDSSDDAPGSEYHGCYLIGLSRPESMAQASKEEKAAAKQALDKVFERFLTVVKSDEKNYDPSTSYIDISLAKPSQTKNLQLDSRDWGSYTPEDFDQDSDDDDDELEEDVSDSDPSTTSLPYRPVASTLLTSSNTPKPKLRPASDILSRLRWDPALDPSDYIVGYEDRFLGPKEISLERWKSEVSDEEFVPMHRILWFRKKGEGAEVVWDRRRRVDLVFGSGGEGEVGGGSDGDKE